MKVGRLLTSYSSSIENYVGSLNLMQEMDEFQRYQRDIGRPDEYEK